MKYKIIRKFFNDEKEEEVIAKDLTLEEAQAYCKDPETSCRTAKGPNTEYNKYGPWFDCYEEDD